jgi:hypothetical protein
VLTAVSAPAVAASQLRGCATLKWIDARLTSGVQGTNGVRTATLRYGTTAVTVSVAQNRTAGLAANSTSDGNTTVGPTEGSGDFSVAAAGAQKASGGTRLESQSSGYVVPTSSTASVLTLNQKSSGAANASQRLSFTFTDAAGKALRPASPAFTLHDVTQITTGTNSLRYTDLLVWGGATATYGTPVGSPSTYSRMDATGIQGSAMSTTSGNHVRVTLTPTSATPTLTYSNAQPDPSRIVNNNRQYVGIGDLTVCF